MNLITALVYLVIIAALAWLASYIVSQFPPPEPVARVINVAIVIVAILAVIFVIAHAFNVPILLK